MTDPEWLEVKCDDALMEEPCGKVACLIRRRRYTTGEYLHVRDIRCPDGSPMEAGAPFVCQSCKRGMPGFAAALGNLGLFD